MLFKQSDSFSPPTTIQGILVQNTRILVRKPKSSWDFTDFDDTGESFLGYRTNSLLIQWERQENLLLSPTWMVKIWWRGDFCLSQQFHKQLKTIQGGTATVLTCICTSATSAALALALSWPCSETIHWSHTHTKLVLRKKNNLPPV